MSLNRPDDVQLVPLAALPRAALLATWNAAAEFDRLTLGLLAEKLAEEPPTREHHAVSAGAIPAEGLPAGVAAVVDGVVAGWGFAVLRTSAAGLRGVVKLLAVVPRFRGRGIGTRLLAALEAPLQAAGAIAIRFGESAPNYLVPGVDVRCETLLRLLERCGYVRIGTTVNMTVDLRAEDFDTAADEARLATAGIAVRRALATDGDPLGRLLDLHWPSWRPEVAAACARRPAAVHVAVATHNAAGAGEGGIAGFAASDGNNVGTGWFGPMGTVPEWEGRGIGRVLLRRCLRDLRGQGLARAVVPWVGPVAFYQRHAAATIDRTFVRLEKSMLAKDRP